MALPFVAQMTEGQRLLLPERNEESSEEDKKLRSMDVPFKGPVGYSGCYQVIGHLGLKVKGVLSVVDKDWGVICTYIAKHIGVNQVT